MVLVVVIVVVVIVLKQLKNPQKPNKLTHSPRLRCAFCRLLRRRARAWGRRPSDVRTWAVLVWGPSVPSPRPLLGSACLMTVCSKSQTATGQRVFDDRLSQVPDLYWTVLVWGPSVPSPRPLLDSAC